MSTQREFENAQPLNIQLWSDDPDFDSYIENLSNRLCKQSDQLNELKQITITKHLKIMVLNLWCIYLKDKKKYLELKQLGWKDLIVWGCETKPSLIKNTIDKLHGGIQSE